MIDDVDDPHVREAGNVCGDVTPLHPFPFEPKTKVTVYPIVLLVILTQLG